MTTYIAKYENDIPKYENDIFVSYADSDNQWVSTLVEGLRILLEQKLGERNVFSFYLPEPTKKKHTDHPIKKSAVFLLILSQEYSKLEHCQNELKKILSEVKENTNRLIVVEKEPWQTSEVILPASKDSHIRFWVEEGKRKLPRTLGVPKPTPEEVAYYQRLYEVANRLEQELTISRAKASLTNLEEEASVFIDAAPQDLDLAGEIKAYLEEKKITCKPPINFDASPAEIRKELDGNLLSCRDIIIFCDSVPDIWVEEHIKYYRKVLQRREKKVRNLIVFHHRMTERDNKLELNFPKNLHEIIKRIPDPLECYSLEECLPVVLKELRT